MRDVVVEFFLPGFRRGDVRGRLYGVVGLWDLHKYVVFGNGRLKATSLDHRVQHRTSYVLLCGVVNVGLHQKWSPDLLIEIDTDLPRSSLLQAKGHGEIGARSRLGTDQKMSL